MVTRKPDQRLKNDVATIAELRVMSAKELKANTCGTCGITYASLEAKRQCARHHLTG
jgi:hypothetical protein